MHRAGRTTHVQTKRGRVCVHARARARAYADAPMHSHAHAQACTLTRVRAHAPTRLLPARGFACVHARKPLFESLRALMKPAHARTLT
eukprot:6188523-Pleurochrysis_carterae.AAC.3